MPASTAMEEYVELHLLKEGGGLDEHLWSTYYMLAMCKTYLYPFSHSILRTGDRESCPSEQLCEGQIFCTAQKKNLGLREIK